MNKTIVTIIVVAVVLAGGFFLLRGSKPSSENAPTAPANGETSAPPVQEQSNGQTTPQPPVGQAPAAPTAPVAKENVITYTDAGYSPVALEVKRGEIATFKNQSSRAMWTASAAHPTHRVYPATGGCIGSTFDACKGVQPNSSWSFRFDIPGTWKYHNHLSPSDTGTIEVKPL